MTGLLTVLGTVGGTVVQGYWDTSLAEIDFQSKLVLRALEPDDPASRRDALDFLVKANLISGTEVREGLARLLKNEHEGALPRFAPAAAGSA